MSKSRTGARWYQDAVIYEVPVKAFADSDGDGIGDFRGLIGKLDYLQELGVTALWLLPFYPSPLRDDGYDTADYTRIHPDLGTMADFRRFLREAHARGLRVITELVLNHTSDQHPWFQRARLAKPGSNHRDYYVWSDDPTKYSDTRIIFTDFEASNWTWDPVAGAYYWHRFYHHQPDLNWDNPEVVRELYKIVDFWLGMGVDGLRLDAVPYLFEREGTNCENLPETHEALRDLRTHVDATHDDKMLLAEANMWPDEVIDYFGGGESGVSDECHMAFHFPLMPRMFMAIRMEDRFPIVDILQETPPLPEGAQWATFLRNHDELTLEMVTDEERDYMWRIYASDPEARINLGIRRRLAPLLGNNRRVIEMINAMLFSLPGTPVLYYGDEIGMGDNVYLGDRDGVRTPMQWNADRNAGFSTGNPQKLFLPVVIDPEYNPGAVNVEAQRGNPESLWWWMRRLIATRKQHPALRSGSLEFLPSDNRKVLTYVRETEDETILCVCNLSRFAQYVQLDLSRFAGSTPVVILGHVEFPPIGDLPYLVTLGPHDFIWFSIERSPRGATQTALPRITESAVPVLEHDGPWTSLLEPGGQIESLLPAYLRERRWFRSKTRRIRAAAIADTIPIGPARQPAGVLVIVRVEFADGDAELYALPLAIARASASDEGLPTGSLTRVRSRRADGDMVIFDGLRSDEFNSALLATIVGRRKRGSTGPLATSTTTAARTVLGQGTGEDPWALGVDQTNSSVAFGDRYLLKVFRRLDEGTSPDIELGRYLTERARYSSTPKLVGSIEYLPDGADEPRSLALLQSFTVNEGDAWGFTLDALGRFFETVAVREDQPEVPSDALLDLARTEPTEIARQTIGGYLESARLLGVRTAQMHRALAAAGPADADIQPEAMNAMYRRSLYQGMRSSARRTLGMIRRLGTDDPTVQRVLERDQELLDRFRCVLDMELGSLRIRCHGDFHLGQVLWTGRDFAIIDFEGEPARTISERRIKRSPLRDVAGMLRSFHYAASKALRDAVGDGEDGTGRLDEWSRFWYAHVAATFVGAYLEEASGAGFLPTTDTDIARMLESQLLDKAVYELRYEVENRPDWIAIPAEGILALLDGGTP